MMLPSSSVASMDVFLRFCDFMYGSLGLGMDEDARVGKLAIQDDEV